MRTKTFTKITTGTALTLLLSFVFIVPNAEAYVFLPRTKSDFEAPTQLTNSVRKKEKQDHGDLATRTRHLANQFSKRAAGLEREIGQQEESQPVESVPEPVSEAPLPAPDPVPQAEPKPVAYKHVERAPILPSSGLGSLFLMSAAFGGALATRKKR